MTRVLASALAAALLAVADACGHPSQDTLAPTVALKTLTGGVTTVEDFERSVTRSMQKAGVTGLSVAVVNDGKTVYTRQFGWKDKDAGTRLNDTTVFAAGSLSKTIFAYLVMVLADERLIDLDAPLQRYLAKPLSQYPRYADLAGDDRFETITARMVLSHTSGLPNLRSLTQDGRLRIQFEPGTRFNYSGEAVELLHMVVENTLQRDLETIARDRVFIPFGMRHTSYVWRDRFGTNVAAPHNEFEWADDPGRPRAASAAGSLMTTAHDYAQFVAGILKAEVRHKQSVARMLTPVVRIKSRRMLGPGSRTETSANDSISLSWALGWGTFETPYGSAFFHTGHTAGTQNYTVVYPARGIGIVLFSNSDNFESVAREIVAAGIGDSYSPFDWLGYAPFNPARRRLAPPRRVVTRVATGIIAPYAGKYRIEQGGAVVFINTEGSHLYVSDDGSSWDEAYAESDSVFFFKGRDLTLTFRKDVSGRVIRMDIAHDGTTIVARRFD